MGMEMKATKSAVKKVPEMIITPQGERIIPAKRSRDGQSFRFDISIDHIIEQVRHQIMMTDSVAFWYYPIRKFNRDYIVP